jgi:hypothetical protein
LTCIYLVQNKAYLLRNGIYIYRCGCRVFKEQEETINIYNKAYALEEARGSGAKRTCKAGHMSGRRMIYSWKDAGKQQDKNQNFEKEANDAADNAMHSPNTK